MVIDFLIEAAKPNDLSTEEKVSRKRRRIEWDEDCAEESEDEFIPPVQGSEKSTKVRSIIKFVRNNTVLIDLVWQRMAIDFLIEVAEPNELSTEEKAPHKLQRIAKNNDRDHETDDYEED